VIDVRGPDEFTGPLGHIGNALNLPIGELPNRLTEVNAGGNDLVVLVCRDRQTFNKCRGASPECRLS